MQRQLAQSVTHILQTIPHILQTIPHILQTIPHILQTGEQILPTNPHFGQTDILFCRPAFILRKQTIVFLPTDNQIFQTDMQKKASSVGRMTAVQNRIRWFFDSEPTKRNPSVPPPFFLFRHKSTSFSAILFFSLIKIHKRERFLIFFAFFLKKLLDNIRTICYNQFNKL